MFVNVTEVYLLITHLGHGFEGCVSELVLSCIKDSKDKGGLSGGISLSSDILLFHRTVFEVVGRIRALWSKSQAFPCGGAKMQKH